jgi:hypothetical protein
MGKGGRCETLKPVAQIMASKAWCVLSEVRMPVEVMWEMGVLMRETLGRRKDSR